MFSESALIEGGTTPFTAPELLVPQKYGGKDGTPTTQADVYAFGLVIFQVCGQHFGLPPSIYVLLIGPYGRNSIHRHSKLGVGILYRYRREAPEKTGERSGHRAFGSLVEFHPTLLG